MSASAWSLHPQLEKDAAPVGDLALCRVLAINDADFPWLVLVPRRLKRDPAQENPASGNDHAASAVTEIADLSDEDAALLIGEIMQVSRVLKGVTGCDKINVAAIGNVVPQLHIHIVARWETDPLWPKPVWGVRSVRPGDAAMFGKFLEAISDRVGLKSLYPNNPSGNRSGA